MNTLAWLGGFTACIWMAQRAIVTYTDVPLGAIMLVVAMICLIQTAMAVGDDIRVIRGRRDD